MSGPRGIIVIVDDDPSVRRGLDRLLRSAGYAVETFASARDFLRRPDYERPDCLILDVRMPEESGLELQELLVTAGYDVPIIFMTGYGDVAMAMRTLNAGAVDFLAKPFDDDEIIDAVRRATIKRPDEDRHRRPARGGHHRRA